MVFASIAFATAMLCVHHPATAAAEAALATELEMTARPPADIAGGAPSASLEAAARFAWRHFVALNWPAAPQTGLPGTRGEPDPSRPFGDPAFAGPLVWETLRSKTEIFPGIGEPHGRDAGKRHDYGFDQPPQYVFDPAAVGRYAPLPAGHIPTCGQKRAAPAEPPWIDLSEAFEAGPEKVFAGHLLEHGGKNHRRVLYSVKVNRPQYVYIAENQWYGGGDPGSTIPAAQTAAYIAQHSRAPPAGTGAYVSFPSGAVEVKAAWRRLTDAERSSGRFHIALVRAYKWQRSDHTYAGSAGNPLYPCYSDEVMGLIGLHFKIKTPSAPYYIWSTFEHADNVRDVDGNPVEDADGRIVEHGDDQVSDPPVISKNAESASPETPSSIQKFFPAQAASHPGQRLYYTNPPGSPTPQGLVSVNRRYHTIPDPVIETNAWAHRALQRYAEAHKIDPSPWALYKLVSVQWRPADKPDPGNDVVGDSGNSDEVLRYPAIYYMANIVIETSHRLQVWSGQIQRSLPPPNAATPVNNLITDFNPDGSPTKNVQFNANKPDGRVPGYNMGGCMGCHGQMQRAGYGFSFILRRGRVDAPEVDKPRRMSLFEMLTGSVAGQH